MEWIGEKFCERCSLIGWQWCKCKRVIVIKTPIEFGADDLDYWENRVEEILGYPVSIFPIHQE